MKYVALSHPDGLTSWTSLEQAQSSHCAFMVVEFDPHRSPIRVSRVWASGSVANGSPQWTETNVHYGEQALVDFCVGRMLDDERTAAA